MCKEIYNVPKKLSVTCRYIDDLITLDNDGLFDNNRGDIYQQSLKLNKKHTEDSRASFLDLLIKVQNKVFHISLFDK